MAVTADDIKQFYRAYLGREPLQSGIDGWLAAAASGQSLVQIATGISQSPEAAVYRAYQQTLGREPEMEERQAWVEEINTTGSVQRAVTNIATSQEAQIRRGMFTGGSDDTELGGQTPANIGLLEQFNIILSKYIEGLDSDDMDRVDRMDAANEWKDALETGDLDVIKAVDVSDLEDIPGWSEYYSSVVGTTEDTELGDLDKNISNADIRQILRDNGYSEEAIDEIFQGEVNNDKFKGNNVLSNALCEIGYSNCSDWSVTARNPDGTACVNDDGNGTYQNGECVTDTSEGTPCWIGEFPDSKEGKRGPDGECIPLSSGGGGGGGSSSDADCTVIDQKNAGECGYEITSDGQLVPIDLSKDPDSYPEYEDCGNGIFALTGECPEIDPSLRELIEEYGREAVEDAQKKLEEIQTVFGKVIDDPLGTLEEIITKTSSASSGSTCSGSDLPEWVRECVTVGVGIGLPFPLPGPLGTIFKGATVGDIEKTIKEAGHDIGKILSGETSIEEVMGDLGDWVAEKVGGIFKDAGEVSIDDVLGTIGSILVGGGYILTQGLFDKYFKDPINNTINVPIIPFSSQECRDSGRRTADAEGNCGECIDPNKIYDANQGQCVDKTEVGSYDCAKEESRKGGTVINSSECNECLDGFEEDAEGNCIQKDTEIGDNGPTAEECLEENKQHIAGDDVTDSSCGACLEGYEPDEEGVCVKKDTVTPVECPDGTMADTLEDCGTTVTTIECPEGTPKVGQTVSSLDQCGTTVTTIECPEGTPKVGQTVSSLDQCGTTVTTIECPEGTPKVGQTVSSLDQCGTTVTTIECPEGTARAGQTVSSLDQCGATTPDPCEGQGSGKVMSSDGTDECVCPEGTVEDAAGNCVTPAGTTPPPEEEEEEESSGGGGGGGGGGRGLFAPLPDYQRQPFVAVQYRAPVRAINVLDGFVKKELKNSLFS